MEPRINVPGGSESYNLIARFQTFD